MGKVGGKASIVQTSDYCKNVEAASRSRDAKVHTMATTRIHHL